MKIKEIIDRRRFKAYKSIEFCPVWNFFKVIETSDLRYLLKLRDYETLPETSYLPQNEWSEMMKQYFDASHGTKFFQFKTFRLSMLELKKKYLILSDAVFVLCTLRDDKVIDIVRKLGYKFNDSDETEYYNSVISLEKQLHGLKKRIELKAIEYSKIFDGNGAKQELTEIVHNLEQFKGFSIDTMQLSVKKFIVYQKEYYKQATAQKVRRLSKSTVYGR